MAVPKKRTGKSAQAKRRANWKATVPATTKCSKCGAVVLTHTVCPECGSYKGKVVSIKNENYVAEDVKVEKQTEEKPKAKRTRKPKAEAVEVKATEVKEEKVEETKAEEAKEEKAEE